MHVLTYWYLLFIYIFIDSTDIYWTLWDILGNQNAAENTINKVTLLSWSV